MTCKKCGSNNVNVQVVSENQRRGCLKHIDISCITLCSDYWLDNSCYVNTR